jgi:hypothetical protein
MNALATIGNNLGLVHNTRRNEWRGACPACSYSGTFAISSKGARLVWWCSNCTEGGREALTAVVREAMGGALAPSPSERHTEADKAEQARQRREWAENLWIRAIPAAGTLAERYLRSRGLASFTSSPALRFLPSIKHTESSSYHPAMIARVTAPDGGFAAIH